MEDKWVVEDDVLRDELLGTLYPRVDEVFLLEEDGTVE